MSWLWIMSTPSSQLSPHTCVLAGLTLKATSPSPQGVKAGGATGWETTSAPTALMGFTFGQVRMRSNKRYKIQCTVEVGNLLVTHAGCMCNHISVLLGFSGHIIVSSHRVFTHL